MLAYSSTPHEAIVTYDDLFEQETTPLGFFIILVLIASAGLAFYLFFLLCKLCLTADEDEFTEEPSPLAPGPSSNVPEINVTAPTPQQEQRPPGFSAPEPIDPNLLHVPQSVPHSSDQQSDSAPAGGLLNRVRENLTRMKKALFDRPERTSEPRDGH